jgi:hypothetical protein
MNTYRFKIGLLIICCIGLLALPASVVVLAVSGTEVISINASGDWGNLPSYRPAISGDGNYVVFVSDATNLVTNDNNQKSDYFLRDRINQTITRIASASWALGIPTASLSFDGQYIALMSDDIFGEGDFNGKADIFIYDRITHNISYVSKSSGGSIGNEGSFMPSVSSDGRYVAFLSYASNLVPNDTNGVFDVFVHDRESGITTRVSVDSNGNQSDGVSSVPIISDNGCCISFLSQATNLVADDTNGVGDIFVHERDTGVTTRVSVDSHGNQANGHNAGGVISGDGRFVVFQSGANNLIIDDTNDMDDIFLHDRNNGTTKRIAEEGRFPDISADGRYIVYESNLKTVGDNNWLIVKAFDRISQETITVGGREGLDAHTPAISANGLFIVYSTLGYYIYPPTGGWEVLPSASPVYITRLDNSSIASIVITKDVIGNKIDIFTICVDMDCKLFAEDGATHTWEVIPGTYTISEQDAGENWREPEPKQVTVAANETLNVTWVNEYVPPVSTINITKDIVGDATGTFSICVNTDCKLFDGDGATQSWQVPPGTYTISEQDAGENWREPAPQEVIVADSQVMNVLITNTYQPVTTDKRTLQVVAAAISDPNYQVNIIFDRFDTQYETLLSVNGAPVEFDFPSGTYDVGLSGNHVFDKIVCNGNEKAAAQYLTSILTVDFTDGDTTCILYIFPVYNVSVQITSEPAYIGDVEFAATFFDVPVSVNANGGVIDFPALPGTMEMRAWRPPNYVLDNVTCGGVSVPFVSDSLADSVTFSVTDTIACNFHYVFVPSVCTSDPLTHLTATIMPTGNPNEWQAQIHNSSTCVYDVGFAAYEKPDAEQRHQKLFSSDVRLQLGQGDTSIIIPTPTCAAQLDVFFDVSYLGAYSTYTGQQAALDQVPLVLPSFASNLYGQFGNWYGPRLLVYKHLSGNYCVPPATTHKLTIQQSSDPIYDAFVYFDASWITEGYPEFTVYADNGQTAFDLSSGLYTVKALVPVGYTLESVTCNGNLVTATDNTVSVDLTANDVTCHFHIVAVPAADSDTDGIGDDVDQCSDTALGIPVDAVGCPIMVNVAFYNTLPCDITLELAGNTTTLAPNQFSAALQLSAGIYTLWITGECTLPSSDELLLVSDMVFDIVYIDDETETPNSIQVTPDTDMDGIADADDACLTTPIGMPVDATGCEIPAIPEQPLAPETVPTEETVPTVENETPSEAPETTPEALDTQQ